MSSTRLRNDDGRISKEMEIFTHEGRYQLDVPKWRNTQQFIEDPHLRIQKIEANKYNNRVDIENSILGYTMPLSRDYSEKDEYLKFTPQVQEPFFDNYTKCLTDETRATLPPYLFRDLEVDRFETPFINPQNDIERNFEWNINTRIIEKDGLYNNRPVANEFNSGYWLPSVN
jgi:hypothetical protein